MTHIGEHEHASKGATKTAGQVITMIVVMNLVFSFDSILSAMALSQYKVEGADGGAPEVKYVMWVMIPKKNESFWRARFHHLSHRRRDVVSIQDVPTQKRSAVLKLLK